MSPRSTASVQRLVMISFACANCRRNLTVQDEFAGRTARCPGCQHPLTVPSAAPDRTNVLENTRALAGVEGQILLAQPVEPAGRKPLADVLAERQSSERYKIAGELARGGMGAVMRAVDCDLRREVAIKFMLDQSEPGKMLRFVEEAQITGQLEHPNIVPVHELGVDAQERLFFAMKMVRGRSLADVLRALRDQPTAEADWPLGRLLRVFVNVCHALAYAHSRGVIHRDLKPSNIMLGDFGEVYVMDWGLAKVVHGGGQRAGAPPAGRSGAGGATARVETDREAASDLTGDGTVLGTPLYMPPEQAAGRVQELDQRSDVYSLGAILYEVLALMPPVGPEAGAVGVLLRVIEGDLPPPELRAPGRAKAGKIPRELSAVARKAMAKAPEARYATVEALRQDVERFLEGRSVSAKDDAPWELLLKFVKRNRGLSAGAAAVVLVLVVSVVVLFRAWQETREAQRATAAAYADLQQKEAEKEQAQKEKREQMVRTVPAILEAARFAANQRKFDTAVGQVKAALDADPTNAEAHLLRAQLLASDRAFAPARAELAECLRLNPKAAAAGRLLALLKRGGPVESGVQYDVADELQKQQLHGLAARLYESAGRSLEAQKGLAAAYRKRLEEVWGPLGDRLRVDDRGLVLLNLADVRGVVNLNPLQDMKINGLDVRNCKSVTDLSPLAGMPLTVLDATGCGDIASLAPLHGSPLAVLKMGACRKITDLSPLAGLPLVELRLTFCENLTDIGPLAGLPLEQLDLTTCWRLTDLRPLRGTKIVNFTFAGAATDLSPLEGLPLREAKFDSCHQLTQLKPLAAAPPPVLVFHNCASIADVSPLRGGRFEKLQLTACPKLSDLSSLEGIRSREIWFTPGDVRKGIEVLRRMPGLEKINDFAAEEFWKRFDAGEIK